MLLVWPFLLQDLGEILAVNIKILYPRVTWGWEGSPNSFGDLFKLYQIGNSLRAGMGSCVYAPLITLTKYLAQ